MPCLWRQLWKNSKGMLGGSLIRTLSRSRSNPQHSEHLSVELPRSGLTKPRSAHSSMLLSEPIGPPHDGALSRQESLSNEYGLLTRDLVAIEGLQFPDSLG